MDLLKVKLSDPKTKTDGGRVEGECVSPAAANVSLHANALCPPRGQKKTVLFRLTSARVEPSVPAQARWFGPSCELRLSASMKRRSEGGANLLGQTTPEEVASPDRVPSAGTAENRRVCR